MKRNTKKGFTLIELIVVVAILAILAAVAVPNFAGMSARATEATEVAAASEVANAINIYNTMVSGDSNVGTIISGGASGTKYTEVESRLTAQGLWPSFDCNKENVFKRLNVTGNIATVVDKGKLGGETIANPLVDDIT